MPAAFRVHKNAAPIEAKPHADGGDTVATSSAFQGGAAARSGSPKAESRSRTRLGSAELAESEIEFRITTKGTEGRTPLPRRALW